MQTKVLIFTHATSPAGTINGIYINPAVTHPPMDIIRVRVTYRVNIICILSNVIEFKLY